LHFIVVVSLGINRVWKILIRELRIFFEKNEVFELEKLFFFLFVDVGWGLLGRFLVLGVLV